MVRPWRKVFGNVAGKHTYSSSLRSHANRVYCEIRRRYFIKTIICAQSNELDCSKNLERFSFLHRSIRIGKILINEGHVIYAKLPSDIHRRRLLVAYPVITTGATVLTGLEVLLKEYQCKQSNIILITLFSTPDGIRHICELYPNITVVISEINTVAPNHFGQKYFGKNP